MTVIVLAAGYATRLRPLTDSIPKPLLDLGGRPILDHILDNALRVSGITKIVVVSNARFHDQFLEWRGRSAIGVPIDVINDGSTTNENRLGALGDLALAAPALDGDRALVLAGDNIFAFELAHFVSWAIDRRADCIATHPQPDLARLRRTGVIELDDNDRVLSFEEKPTHPRSEWAVPPLYCFLGRSLREILPRYLAAGHDPDAPGSFIPFLLSLHPVYAYRFDGRRYDIGTLESYQEVKELFADH